MWIRGALIAGLAVLASTAQATLVFAINEGVTYRVPSEEIRARYAGITADLSKLLRQPVVIEPVGAYPMLRKGLSEKAYDIAMVHPAHLSIEAIKKTGYKLVVVTKGFQDYSANFLVKSDSPLKSLAELKGRKIGAPDEDSITSWMVRATLRDALGNANQVEYLYTRYQDAVPFFVEKNFTPAGATASRAVIKAWESAGGKVLAKSRTVPIKHIIASPSLSVDQVDKLREYLLALDSTEEGKKKLEATKYTGFARYDEAAMLAIGTWLGL
ncbi:MAG: phosphate/phosphite/phosphonate ABC transporter substrate-binding protein [Rhizobacter sp.]|nr:phosphate/phosphite/phosphonate ABC transporter substrate-binding protein [Rhizobacter sp.]